MEFAKKIFGNSLNCVENEPILVKNKPIQGQNKPNLMRNEPIRIQNKPNCPKNKPIGAEKHPHLTPKAHHSTTQLKN